MTGKFFEQLRRRLLRLPRNIQSNRWYVLFLGHVYFHSGRHAKAFARRVGISDAGDVQKNPIRMYVSPKFFFSSPVRMKSEHIGILFPHLGRFGNAIREIVSAAAVARKHNLGHLALQGFSLFSSTGELANPGLTRTEDGLNLWIERKPRGPIKQGAPHALIRWSRRSVPLVNDASAWKETKFVLPSTLQAHVSDPDTIVLHLRGGDVFGGRSPKAYGQPPLSFYLWVLGKREWHNVVIVHQDDKNPVLAPLIEACHEQGLNVEKFSGSLVEDLTLLLGAHTIVAGRGTFIPAIVGLSDSIRTVYYFEDKFVLFPERPDVEITRVLDADGRYRNELLSNNWANSPEQRGLMVEYPLSHLKQG